MTEEQMNLLKLLKDEEYAEIARFNSKKKQHDERMYHLQAERHKLFKQCDHKYPTGEWATMSSFFYNACKICGSNDA